MELFVIFIILISLISILIIKYRVRQSAQTKRVSIAAKYDSEIIDPALVPNVMPSIFNEIFGIFRNSIKLNDGILYCEYHFTLFASGSGSVSKYIEMVIFENDKNDEELSYINNNIFIQHQKFYPISVSSYQCSEKNEVLIDELMKSNISMSKGPWGSIFIPNSGRIKDIDNFLEIRIKVSE